MIRKGFKDNKGFTLIELIITIAITSIVILISANLLLLVTKSHKATLNEYDLQSSVRQVTEQATKIVRYSKALFAVPQAFVKNTSNMDPGWKYFMVSSDKKRIVEMVYEGSSFVEKVLVAEQGNIEYEVVFERETKAIKDNVMIYKINAFATDSSGKRTNEKLVFASTVESTNAVQVVDKGTKASPSIALAYRNDGQTGGMGKKQIAYITIVTDVSGSMNSSIKVGENPKIKNVKEALKGTTTKQGIIQKFSEAENLFVSFVPFSTTGNYPYPIANSKPTARHPIYEVNKAVEKDNLITKVQNTTADGGTNTGDGLRQAYNLHNDFRTIMGEKVTAEEEVHHYMILLVDGETTFETKNGKWNSSWWSYEFSAATANPKYYLGKGNINLYYNSKSYSTKPTGNYAITGNGSTVINNSPYVTAVGNSIKSFDSGNGVKSYLIGYANDITSGAIRSLGDSIGTDESNTYRYSATDFNLDEVFQNIANDIMADFWLVTGPQIINK